MCAYKNCLLEVDLSTREVGKTEINQEVLRQYVGGSGLAGKIIIERGVPVGDPFSDDNHLFFMTGPLTGTKFPGTGRFTAVAKSPLTGIWGESNCGGNFGPELKFAGYDGIIIKGKSSGPVYILIEDEKVEICDASKLWGRDTFEVVDTLKEKLLGKKKPKVLAIGSAGEHLVRFASILNEKSDALGRTGLGAIMGSKKLKAIAVRGTGKAWKPQDDSKYESFIQSLRKKLKENPFTETMHRLGTNAGMIIGRKTGDIPTKNWSLGKSDEYAKPLLPYHMLERHFVRHQACYACPVGCKKEVMVRQGTYKTEKGPAPEYETFASFGPMLLIKEIEPIIKIHNICNRYGLDVISCGNTIAFAMECFEKGLITKNETDGLDLRWGDAEAVIKLVEKIAHRDGFGDLLAEGSKRAADKIGQGAADLTVEVKGLEMPMHDPRAFHGHGLSYVTSNRGACHMQHLVHLIETNNTRHPEMGLEESYERHTREGKAKMTAICDDFGAILNAAPMCQFVFGGLGGDDLAQMLSMVTGFDYTLEELQKCGERLWYLKRIINNIIGVRAVHDRLPKKVMISLSEGGTKGTVPDMTYMLEEYYQLRDIDNDGIPRFNKLKDLGLYELLENKYLSLFS